MVSRRPRFGGENRLYLRNLLATPIEEGRRGRNEDNCSKKNHSQGRQGAVRGSPWS